jgi:hypothetical protein
MKDNNKEGSLSSGKELDRQQGNSWKQSPLAMLCGGPMLPI